MFPPTAPFVNVVVAGVVSTGVIIVTVVVVIVCLLIVGKKYRHKKKYPSEDYTAAATAFCSLLLFFFTAPIGHIYCKQSTTENGFVLSHMHVQICRLTSFHFASQFFFYRYVEKKVKIRHTIPENFVLSEFEFSA